MCQTRLGLQAKQLGLKGSAQSRAPFARGSCRVRVRERGSACKSLVQSSSQDGEKFSKVATALLRVTSNSCSHQLVCRRGAWTAHRARLHPSRLTQSHQRPVWHFSPALTRGSFLTLGFEELDLHSLISISGYLRSKERGGRFLRHTITQSAGRWAFQMIGLKEPFYNGSTITSLQGKFLGFCIKRSEEEDKKVFLSSSARVSVTSSVGKPIRRLN